MEGAPLLSRPSLVYARWARSGPRLRSLTPYLAPILVLSSPRLARIPAEVGHKKKEELLFGEVDKWGRRGNENELTTSLGRLYSDASENGNRRERCLVVFSLASVAMYGWRMDVGDSVASVICFKNGIGSFQRHE